MDDLSDEDDDDGSGSPKAVQPAPAQQRVTRGTPLRQTAAAPAATKHSAPKATAQQPSAKSAVSSPRGLKGAAPLPQAKPAVPSPGRLKGAAPPPSAPKPASPLPPAKPAVPSPGRLKGAAPPPSAPKPAAAAAPQPSAKPSASPRSMRKAAPQAAPSLDSHTFANILANLPEIRRIAKEAGQDLTGLDDDEVRALLMPLRPNPPLPGVEAAQQRSRSVHDTLTAMAPTQNYLMRPVDNKVSHVFGLQLKGFSPIIYSYLPSRRTRTRGQAPSKPRSEIPPLKLLCWGLMCKILLQG